MRETHPSKNTILVVMFHLVYTSYAVEPFSSAALIDLLNQSRAYNKTHGITGMLIYSNGRFIQALEGEMTDVERVYSSIYKDPRHKRVIRVIEGESKERIFKDWSMGFKNLTEVDFNSMEGFQDIEIFFDKHKKAESSNLVTIFLRLFYEKNIVDYPEFAA